MSEHRGCLSHPHPVGVIDALTPGQNGLDDGHRLDPHVHPPRGPPQIDILIEQAPQPQVLGEGGGLDQPGVGHRPMIIEGDPEPVETVAR